MLWSTYGAEQRVAGKYQKIVEDIRGWHMDSDNLPKASYAKAIHISLPVFDGVLSLIQEHPDWDDETIANEADWRAQ